MTILKNIIENKRDIKPSMMVLQDNILNIIDKVDDQFVKTGKIVEVGSYLGGSTIRMAMYAKELGIAPIYSIDCWECQMVNTSVDDNTYQRYIQNITEAGVSDDIVVIKGDSAKSAVKFDDDSVSFMFLDADHYYESVAKDLRAWIPKIQKDGFLLMDDFGPWGGTDGPEGAARDVIVNTGLFRKIGQSSTVVLFRKNSI